MAARVSSANKTIHAIAKYLLIERVYCKNHPHPSCLKLNPSFHTFVMWLTLSPSNRMM